MLDQTKQLVLKSISKQGFGWDDVEDIFPAQNFVGELSRSGVLDSGRFHFVDLATTEKDPEVRTIHPAFAVHELTILIVPNSG